MVRVAPSCAMAAEVKSKAAANKSVFQKHDRCTVNLLVRKPGDSYTPSPQNGVWVYKGWLKFSQEANTNEDLVHDSNTCLFIAGPGAAARGAEPGFRCWQNQAVQHHQAEASRRQAGLQLHPIEDGYRRLLRTGQA